MPDEVAGGMFAVVDEERAVPGNRSHHRRERLFRVLVDDVRGEVPCRFLREEFFLRKLLVAETILFVSEIEAKKAIAAVAAIIEERRVMDVFTV